MISLAGYKVLHILGTMLLFAALGGSLITWRDGGPSPRGRSLIGMTHGLALVLILVTGFGALARLGMSNPGIWPLWMWIKVVVWLALGGAVVLIRRSPRSAGLLWWLLPILGALAGYLAISKPS